MNTKDDCFPYYLSKLEFLQMYGKACSKHERTCKDAKTEEQCNKKRVLQCIYTNDECIQIIDHICKFYDKHGNIREEEWGEDQITYIDDLYKTAVNTSFGEFMLGAEYNKTVKTTAFQIISNKLNHIEYSASDDNMCSSSVKMVLMQNKDFMNELEKMRKKAYNDMAEEHSQPFIFTYSIKNSELALYVFELLKTKKCGSYKTIFKHNSTDDSKIYDILTKGAACFKEENAKDKNSSFFNLANFEKNDFEYDIKVPTTGFIWNLQKTIFDIVRNSFMGIGNIILSIGKIILQIIYTGKDILVVIITFGAILVVITTIICFILQGCNMYYGVKINDSPLGSMLKYIESFSILKPILPYLEKIIDANSRLLCLISSILQSKQLINKITGAIGTGIAAKTKMELNAKKVMGVISRFIDPNATNPSSSLSFINSEKIEEIKDQMIVKVLGFILSSSVFFTKTIDTCFSSGTDINSIIQNDANNYVVGMDVTSSTIETFKTLYKVDKTIDVVLDNINYLKKVYLSPDGFTYLKSFLESMYNSPLDNVNVLFGVITAIIEYAFAQYTSIQFNISTVVHSKIASDIYDLYMMFVVYDINNAPASLYKENPVYDYQKYFQKEGVNVDAKYAENMFNAKSNLYDVANKDKMNIYSNLKNELGKDNSDYAWNITNAITNAASNIESYEDRRNQLKEKYNLLFNDKDFLPVTVLTIVGKMALLGIGLLTVKFVYDKVSSSPKKETPKLKTVKEKSKSKKSIHIHHHYHNPHKQKDYRHRKYTKKRRAYNYSSTSS